MPATEADLALVKEAFETFRVSRDFLDEYFERFFAPNTVIEAVDGLPVPGRYEGREGYLRWFDDAYGPYVDVQRRLDSLTLVGDWVVALLTLTGRQPGDELVLQVESGTLYRVESGRICEMRIFRGHEHALAAAKTPARGLLDSNA